MYEHNSELEDSDPEDDAGDVVYDEDDEEGMLEMRMREKGRSARTRTRKPPRRKRKSPRSPTWRIPRMTWTSRRSLRRRSPAAPPPPPHLRRFRNERWRRRKAHGQGESRNAGGAAGIMREASRRARLTGYHVAPDRDPFAYRKVFAHVAACVERLNLPSPSRPSV